MNPGPPTQHSDPYLGRALDNKYRLERPLGQGGMGSVYLATHLGTERVVAVKLITPRFIRNDQFVERFKREARAAGRLRHPNIVDVTDFGFAFVDGDSVAYLVMEYLDGCTLSSVLKEERSLPLPWVVDIFEQICSAVQAAHRQGIIHRDLKPDNIWLEPNSLGGFRVKVLDFGIAKILDEGEGFAGSAKAMANSQEEPSVTASTSITADAPKPVTSSQNVRTPASTCSSTQAETVADSTADGVTFSPFSQKGKTPNSIPTLGRSSSSVSGVPGPAGTPNLNSNALTHVGALLGTPQYMSPEQCRGEPLDARSDIYSLGVIAYTMLCGVPPIEGNAAFILQAHATSKPIPLHTRNRKLIRGVAEVVMSALDKNPEARPQSAAAFAHALKANADGLGRLYRRAFALYSEYFPTILKLSLIAHLPMILVLLESIALGQIVTNLHGFGGQPLKVTLGMLHAVTIFLQWIANWVTASCISGVVAVLVTQLSIAPLRPIGLRNLFQILKGRWKPFAWAGFHATIRILFGFGLLVLPGLVLSARYLLWSPVVLLERLEGKVALERSAALTARSRRDIVLAMVFQMSLPFLMQKGFAILIGHYAKSLEGGNPQILSQLSSLVSIVVSPLVSIVPALLYLKMRELGGEALSDLRESIHLEGTRPSWETPMKTFSGSTPS